VQMLWQGFRGRYGERLTPAQVEVGERLAPRVGRLAEIRQGPRCLTHNDFRPDNMMFGGAADGRAVTVLDWQSIAYGVGAVDVAYFLAGALAPDVRRAHEPELLARYHRGLTALGVSGYSAQDLARDYAGGAFLLFLTAFFAAMVVRQTPRGDDMFMQMIGGATQHIHDHDALALLD
jgi:aminoglycoside phosphotransferase (APT) family kinase protein